MYVLFKTDKHHSTTSQELLGVATSKAGILKIVKKVAKQEEAKFTEQDERQLLDGLQTQGYELGEFLAVEVQPNELVE